jgi:hypothetical protein
MQTMGQNGYTDQEVEDELRFKRGKNKMGFRYDLLDFQNNFIRPLTNILSCTVKQDYTSDIKRVATISMLDDVSIDYLTNRIKPWARLYMPTDSRTYTNIINQYASAWTGFFDLDETAIHDSMNLATRNMMHNADFEIDTLHWAASTNGNIGRTTADHHQGTAAGTLTAIAAGGAQVATSAFVNAGEVPVVPGLPYSVSAYLKAPTTVRTANIQIQWRDNSQNILGLTNGSNITESLSAWTRAIWTDTAPANAAWARVVILVNGCAAGEVHYFDSIQFEQSAAPTAFDDPHVGRLGTSVIQNRSGIVAGSATEFTGLTTSVGYIQIPLAHDFFNSALDAAARPTSSSFTISQWIKPTTAAFTSMTIWRNSTNTISLSFDSQGRVVFSATSVAGATKVTTCPNPYGQKLIHILISWKIGGLPQIYLNGLLQANTIQTGEPNSPVDGGPYDLWIGYGYIGVMDSLVFMNIALTSARVSEIYRSGAKTGPFGNINYAEWPQGVFLLSSPSRSLDESSVVTRGIECMDQLEVQTDDQAQTRYVAQKGSLYLNCVLGIMLSYQAFKHNLYKTSEWSRTNASATSPIGTPPLFEPGSITGPTASGANGFYTPSIYTVANLDFQASVTNVGLTWGASGARGVRYRFFMDANNYAEIVVKAHEVGNTTLDVITKLVQNGATIGTNTTNYANAAAPKFVRITEFNGYIIFQTGTGTSSNITWTTRQTSAALPYLSVGRLSAELFTTVAESAWSLNVTINAVAAPWQNINATPSSAFLQVSKEYDPGTSKLAIANDLLAAINYEPVFYDENGNLVLTPYMSPSVMPEEFVYADDDEGVTLPGNMTQTLDLFKIPNTWVGTATSVDGTSFSNLPGYPKINSSVKSPTSTVNRKRTITKVLTNIPETPDLPTLLAYLDKQAEQDSQVYEIVAFQTAIIPIHGDRSILRIRSSKLGIDDKYEELGWSFDFKEGAAMSHTARKFVDIS